MGWLAKVPELTKNGSLVFSQTSGAGNIYSSVARWVKAWMTFVVMRSNALLLRGSRTHNSWKPDGANGFTAGAEGVLHGD